MNVEARLCSAALMGNAKQMCVCTCVWGGGRGGTGGYELMFIALCVLPWRLNEYAFLAIRAQTTTTDSAMCQSSYIIPIHVFQLSFERRARPPVCMTREADWRNAVLVVADP